AMGKATVASPQALEGLQAQPGLHLLTASACHEWIDALTRLLDDPGARRHLGAAGRQYTERHHDWARCLTPLDTLLGLPSDAAADLADATTALEPTEVSA